MSTLTANVTSTVLAVILALTPQLAAPIRLCKAANDAESISNFAGQIKNTMRRVL